MAQAKVYREEWEVDARLQDFGVSREELVEVVRTVVAARADAVEDDPLSAEGLFAYIYGTRRLRQVFRSKGWMSFREDNVESVRHPDRNLLVVYQSVDQASNLFHTPQAVSGKGSGADRLISAGQGTLFPDTELVSLTQDALSDLKFGTWFFCVSVDGEDVRAELSRPTGIAGRNFEAFAERIFIVREGEWTKLMGIGGEDTPPAEFEPIISRK
jgi:hypothetical protein